MCADGADTLVELADCVVVFPDLLLRDFRAVSELGVDAELPEFAFREESALSSHLSVVQFFGLRLRLFVDEVDVSLPPPLGKIRAW